jgi:cytochrome c-type biogenesis protein CcmH/NrfF
MKTSVYKRIAQIAVLSLSVALLLGAESDARFRTLGHKLMCKCGCNQILLECNHVGCTMSDTMRTELAASLGRGENDSMVLQFFVQKYGPTVQAAPDEQGFGRVAWITPYVVLILGIVMVWALVRAWRDRPAPAFADGVRPIDGADLDHFREQVRSETDL